MKTQTVIDPIIIAFTCAQIKIDAVNYRALALTVATNEAKAQEVVTGMGYTHQSDIYYRKGDQLISILALPTGGVQIQYNRA
jgi:hypothetical protein